MDPKDIRNLQEAYISVYTGDIREQQEFESWITGLLDEGYDLSDYNWDEMYEIYNEEYKGGPEFGMKYSKPKPPSGRVKPESEKGGYGGDEKFTKPDDKIEKPGTTVPPFKKGGYGRIMSNIPHGIGAHRDKIASRITTITGGDPGAPTSQKMRAPDKKRLSREIIRKTKNEEYDLYDIILSHLIDEGYADTYEAAESIMVNMSEDWRESIVEAKVDFTAGRGPFANDEYPGEGSPQDKGVKSANRKIDNARTKAGHTAKFGPRAKAAAQGRRQLGVLNTVTKREKSS